MDFVAYYYGEHRPSDEVDGRLDIASTRFAISRTLFRLAALAEDPVEYVDCALAFSSWSVQCDMMMSPVIEPSRKALSLSPGHTQTLRMDYLVERAQQLLRGVGLAGAYRALAYTALYTTGLRAYRPRLTLQARIVLEQCDSRAGIARVIADDAHAYLAAVPEFPPPAAANAAYRGYGLLIASAARALQEPWNPFLANGLKKELAEHSVAEESLPVPQRDLAELARRAVCEVWAHWGDATDDYFRFVSNGVPHQEAFVLVNAMQRHAIAADLTEALRAVLAEEPEWIRQI